MATDPLDNLERELRAARTPDDLPSDLEAALQAIAEAFGLPVLDVLGQLARYERRRPFLRLVALTREAISLADASLEDQTVGISEVDDVVPAEELARRQGTKPWTPEDVARLHGGDGGTWASDEEFEAWLDDIYAARRDDVTGPA